jgi:hypothetical protein
MSPELIREKPSQAWPLRGPALLLAAGRRVRRLAHTPAHQRAGCGLALLHHKVSRSYIAENYRPRP